MGAVVAKRKHMGVLFGVVLAMRTHIERGSLFFSEERQLHQQPEDTQSAMAIRTHTDRSRYQVHEEGKAQQLQAQQLEVEEAASSRGS